MDPRTRRMVTLGVLALLVIALILGAFVSQGQAATAAGTGTGTATATAAAATGTGTATGTVTGTATVTGTGTATVTGTGTGTATGDSVKAAQRLADTYAPAVVVRLQEDECGPGESFRPVAVDSVLGRDDVVLRDAAGETITAAPTAGDLANLPDGGAGTYLDFPGDPLDPDCDYEEWFRSRGDLPKTVYARVARDDTAPDTLVLQYWFWWVYNDWNDKHEGDWEMVQLTFPASSAAEALAVEPESVAFAQHEGAEVAEWDDPKLLRDGTHIAVYPGEGSHAAYFTQSQWFGKGAASGFGCDNTGLADGLSGDLFVPQVTLIDDETEWVQYLGRWGQRAPSFNNGPTGPATKDQWTSPVEWQEAEGRETAVALPIALSASEEAFCSLTAAGSGLFVYLLGAPIQAVLLVLLVVALIVLAVRSTTWRGSPDEIWRQRTAGQILVGPIRVLRDHGGEFGGVLLALMGLLLVSYWIQLVWQQPVPTSDLAAVGALPDNGWAEIGLLIGSLVTTALSLLCSATAIGIVRDLPTAHAGAIARQSATRHGMWRALLTTAVVLLCLASLILFPLGVYLAARWAVATPAAVFEDRRVGAAGRRSSELTAQRRWRALGILAGAAAIAGVPGPFVGALLLLTTDLSFSIINVVVLLLSAVAGVVASIVLALHFIDLRLRVGSSQDAPADPGTTTMTEVPA